VRCVYEDRSHILWIGTHGGGLNRLDPETGRITRYLTDPNDSESINNNALRTIFEDRDGMLWIGTYGSGLDCLDRETGVFSHYTSALQDPASLSNDIIRVIFEDEDETGELLWIGTEGGGLNRFDRSSGTFRCYRNIPADPTSLSEDHVFSIHETSDGMLWIGTFAGGLNRFDRRNEVFTSYTTKNGLPSNAVYGILEDDQGNLWLSTNNGLSRFNPRTESFTNYDARDGLQSNEFNGGAYYRSRSGEMFFGGINGLNAFFPEQITDNPHTPPVVITDFQMFNKSVMVGAEINNSVILTRPITDTASLRLSYQENFFSFEFAGLHYVAPEQNQYAYMMAGFDKEWNYVGNRRFATYTNLPPGDYTFKVKAANSDAVWNEEGVSLQIAVTPPFWQTGWFRLAVLALLVTIIVTVHHLRTKAIRFRNLRLRQELRVRKKAEAAMRQAMLAAKEANRVKSEFLANISHEFRTPMNGILGMTAITLDSELDRQQREQLNIVKTSAEDLLEIMNNVLDFSRLESGSLDLNETEFTLPKLLNDCLGNLGDEAREQGLEFTMDLHPDLPARLQGDSSGLRNILKQVVGNAIKFTEKGRVEVAVEHETVVSAASDPATAEPDDSVSQVRLQFTVKDTGIGIAPENLETIFDSFRQVDGSFTRDFGGTGIGLSFCRQLLSLMNGTVRLESELGQGSTFFFTAVFGLADAQESAPPATVATTERVVERVDRSSESPSRSKPAVDTTGRHILLVEDVIINQRVACGILERAGHLVTVANNGQEALDRLEQDEFDLVLMDIQMPVMNGFEASERIRSSQASYRDLPIIALTAHTLEEDRKQCEAAGMNDFLAKPVNAKAMFAAIARASEMHCTA